MKRIWTVISIMLIVLILLLVQSEAIAGAPNTKANDKATYKKISVVSTNDFHGALVGAVHSWSHDDMVGGAEWLAGYLNIVEEENPGGVLYLDAGDLMYGPFISNYYYGASTIEAINQMGLDAMAIGHTEFNWGQNVLSSREHDAHFPFLAANILYTDTLERPDWAKPYIIKSVKGIKVGVIGVANPDTPLMTKSSNVVNLTFTDPAVAINSLIGEVEAKGATVIIVVAHIGGFWPDFNEGIKDLAEELDRDHVDLIVSGHTHSRIDDVLNGIPTVQAYSDGTAFSRVDFTIDKHTGEVVSYQMNTSPTTTYQTYYGDPASYQRWDTGERVTVLPDPEVAAIVDYYEAEIQALENEVIGESTTAITRNYRYESSMGDLVADVMRDYDPGIDFALTNSGGLRADIDAGPITFGEAFNTLPFEDTLVVVELDGDEVRQALEEGIDGTFGIVQVSGLHFMFDYDEPAGSRIIGDVIDLSTGLPLNPSDTYYVAVNDFIANGGDNYTVLTLNPQVDSHILIRELFTDWIKANSPFTPPDPSVEQRITASGTPPL